MVNEMFYPVASNKIFSSLHLTKLPESSNSTNIFLPDLSICETALWRTPNFIAASF